MEETQSYKKERRKNRLPEFKSKIMSLNIAELNSLTPAQQMQQIASWPTNSGRNIRGRNKKKRRLYNTSHLHVID